MVQRYRKPPLRPQVTTLWEYPSQSYGEGVQGDPTVGAAARPRPPGGVNPPGPPRFEGATPSYVIWNLLQRYTRPKQLVVDPMAGSGTTLDVARDLGRKALGYDVSPTRKDIFRVDARHLPPELTDKVDLVFCDPPYSTHIHYSDDPRCIGKLSAAGPEYFQAMEQVFGEAHRILRPGRVLAVYVSDSFVKGEGFYPIGFELFGRLRKRFEPLDIVAVVRHNRTLQQGNYRKAAEEGNFFLRGFNYLFIVQKPAAR
jgi:adenine-specific DNA-methyltransferase